MVEDDIGVVMGDPTIAWSMGISKTLTRKVKVAPQLETRNGGTLNLIVTFSSISSKEELIKLMTERASTLWDRWEELQC